MSNNMLIDHNEDASFLQDEIKKLDKLFDNQGLSGLNDNDVQKSFDKKKEKMMSHLLQLEEENTRLDDKCKEKGRIN